MDKEKALINHILNLIIKTLIEQHPKLQRVDSNLFHFIIYDIAEKNNLPITRGWFKNGQYIWKLDDILIEKGMMDKSQHQIHGNEQMMEYMIECECHPRKK